MSKKSWDIGVVQDITRGICKEIALALGKQKKGKTPNLLAVWADPRREKNS